jgi:hypothetical protein
MGTEILSLKSLRAQSGRIVNNTEATFRRASSLPRAVGGALNSAVDTFERSGASLDFQKMQGDLQKMRLAQAASGSLSIASRTKAEYTYKMLTLVELPKEGSLKELKVAILGDSSVKAAFKQTIQGKKVRGLPVRVVEDPSPAQLKGLSVLYLGPNCGDNAPKSGVLTIDSSSPGSELKACARIITVGDKARFHLNVDELRDQQIKVSPRLVKVASALYKNNAESD